MRVSTTTTQISAERQAWPSHFIRNEDGKAAHNRTNRSTDTGDFFKPKTVPIESDVAHLLRIVEDHDVLFHELAHRILDGMGVPRVKKESAVS